MPNIKVEGTRMVVHLSWLEALGAARCFHPIVCVPLTKVRLVRVSDDPWQELTSWLRVRNAWYQPAWCPCPCPLFLHGIFIPQVILLGTVYRKDGERAFTAVYKDKPAVVVEMKVGWPGWDFIIVSCESAEQAEQMAQELDAAVVAAHDTEEQRRIQDTAAALAARDRCDRALRLGHQQSAPAGYEQQQQRQEQQQEQQPGHAAGAPAGSAAAEEIQPQQGASSSSRHHQQQHQHVQHQHVQHVIPIVEPAESGQEHEAAEEWRRQLQHAADREAAQLHKHQHGAHHHEPVVINEEGVQLHEAAAVETGQHADSRQHHQHGSASPHSEHSSRHITVLDEKGAELHEMSEQPQVWPNGDVEEARKGVR